MAFEDLKERHAAMWGSAPFERIAGTLADMHTGVVEAVDGAPDRDWLDVGCGTGELAFMAAATGATVTGADLSPVPVETARRQAAERGVDVTFEVGDAEALPYQDGSFDIVTSSVGAIFAPDHAGRGIRAGTRLPARRKPRTLGMDVWRLGRRVLPDHRLLRAAAAARRGHRRVVGRARLRRGAPRQRLRARRSRSATPRGRSRPPEEMWTVMSEAFGPIKTLLGALPPGAVGSVQGRAARVLRGRGDRERHHNGTAVQL